jgi:hypothetical protein
MRYRLLVVFCSMALLPCLEPLPERSCRTVRADQGDAARDAGASGVGVGHGRLCVARAGLTPTPSQSGQAFRALGITKADHGDLRTMAVEMAWGWGRCQPESPLTPWYQARCGRGRARLRTSGSVALARKWLLARWRFRTTGGVPAGALLKAQVAV